MRFYHDYDNRRGNNYGAGMSDGCTAHTRGWNAGVSVRINATGPDSKTDAFEVYMTSGSSGHRGSTHLGTVTDTPDGPQWTPAENRALVSENPERQPQMSPEARGLARNALELAIAALTGHADPQFTLDDLRAELARLTR